MPRFQPQIPDRFGFSTLVQVYLHHVNQQGHLDHAQLLALVSEARSRFVGSLGWHENDVGGAAIVVAQLQVAYLSEGFHGETLCIRMQPSGLARCGFELAFHVAERDSDRSVAAGLVGIVFIDAASRRAVDIPAAVRARLQSV